MAGSFGYELDLNLLSDAEKQAVTEQIQQFKAYGPLIHNGRYYRLTNPMTDAEAIWAFAAQDGSEILVQGMIFHAEANTLRHQVKLRGLCAEKQYRLDGTEQVYTGAALMAGCCRRHGAIIRRYPCTLQKFEEIPHSTGKIK